MSPDTCPEAKRKKYQGKPESKKSDQGESDQGDAKASENSNPNDAGSSKDVPKTKKEAPKDQEFTASDAEARFFCKF